MSLVRRDLIRTTLAATAAALAVGAPAAGAADTFSGSCAGLEGYASWPEQPLTAVPVDMLMRARLSGGECSGTLNGEQVTAVPAAARAELRGPQSCGVGATSGRFAFRIAGRSIAGRMTYRRVGSRVTALWEGDAGGAAVVVVHAQVGVLGDETDLGETLRRCAAEGISRIPIAVDRIVTVPSLSG
jgi:hypothetical protein